MTIVHLLAARLAWLSVVLALTQAVPVLAFESSPWVKGLHSRARLVFGGPWEGRLLAGIEIALDKDFKTYWRNPGESGLPPRFDWAGSGNAGVIDVRWPAPARTHDQGGVAHTYAQTVLFPVLVTPKQPDAPVRLALSLDYGVCKDICIPAHAKLSLTLSATPSARSGDSAHLVAALAKVPRVLALGAGGELSILYVRPVGKPGDKPQIAVTVRHPAGVLPALFAEGPETWFLSTPAAGERVAADMSRFLVTVEHGPKTGTGPTPFRFTLVAGESAIETEVSLDVGAGAR